MTFEIHSDITNQKEAASLSTGCFFLAPPAGGFSVCFVRREGENPDGFPFTHLFPSDLLQCEKSNFAALVQNPHDKPV